MSYDLMFQKAIELQNSGALNQAEEIYLQILQVMPENSDVWNLLGLIAQSKGNLSRARDCFLTAIKYAPKPFFAHYFNLGLTYKSLNKNKESLEAIQKSVQLKPDFKEGWNLLGILQAENNEKTAAVKSFCKALDIDNNYEEARVNLCFYTSDLSTLIKLANKEENNFMAQFRAAEASDDFEQKEKYLRRAIAISPERTDALFALAQLLEQKGNVNESLTLYHKVLNLDENNIGALLGVADIYLNLEQLDKAEKYYLKSFDISREVVGAHINYGALLYRQRRFSEALEEYRTAVKLAPQKSEISYNLALILKEVGDIEEALGLMFNAHLKDPNNEIYAINIMETLALFYEENPESALKIAENWQKKEPDNIFSKRMFASLSGVSCDVNNVEYAEKLFDNFAQTYDKTLQELKPSIISSFKKTVGTIKGRVLDLGCGTGSAADFLKNKDNCFDGVDISSKMLDIARAKGKYENLYHQDINEFVTSARIKGYDWILIFDVFCYFDDVYKLLKKLKGSKIAFSIENGDEARGQDFYLTPSGRYKHKASYIKRILKELKFKQIQSVDLSIREENGKPVSGTLFCVE